MDSTIQTLIEYKAIAIVIWLGLFFALERIIPAAKPPESGDMAGEQGFWRLFRNGSLFGVNMVLSILVVVPITVAATGYGWQWRPDWVQGWQGIIFDLILLDLWIYWWHRSVHTIPLLWRFHEVHHLDRHLDTTSAVRFHFGEVFLSACVRGCVIILMGVQAESVLIFETVLLMAALFQHSNVKIPAKLEYALSRVIITPSLHWVHHHAVQSDTDSTYGSFFSFWDRIFGSSSKTVRTMDMEIGTQERAERDLKGLLLRPFTG